MIIELLPPKTFHSLFEFLNNCTDEEMKAFRKIHNIPKEVTKETLLEGFTDDFIIDNYIESDYDAIEHVVKKVWKGVYVTQVEEPKGKESYLSIAPVKFVKDVQDNKNIIRLLSLLNRRENLAYPTVISTRLEKLVDNLEEYEGRQ